MDRYLIECAVTLNGKPLPMEAPEGALPTTLDAATTALFDQFHTWGEGLTAVRVTRLEAASGCFFDVTAQVVALVREAAFDDECRRVLEHPIIHPDGFCFDCWKAEKRCHGCRMDWAAE